MSMPVGRPIRAVLAAFAALGLLAGSGSALAGTRTAPTPAHVRYTAPHKAASAVTEAPTLIRGTIERVEDEGSVVVLRLPPIRPVCRVGRPCPQFIALAAPVEVNLAHAVFETAAGTRIPRPALRDGLLLWAAGHYASVPSASRDLHTGSIPMRVFDAAVASVS